MLLAQLKYFNDKDVHVGLIKESPIPFTKKLFTNVHDKDVFIKKEDTSS